MPTNYELSILAKDAYAPKTEVRIAEGRSNTVWRRKDEYTVSQKGFSCAFYETTDGPKGVTGVLAFRGSDDWTDWVFNNATIVAGGMPPQAFSAIDMAKRALSRYRSLTLTGHSLGGALAIIAGAHTGLKVVTFNAPGVKDGCMTSSYLELFSGKGALQKFMSTVKTCHAGTNITNLRSDSDIVSTSLLRQVGRRDSLPSSCRISDVNCWHGMDTISNQLTSPKGASGSW